MLDAIAEDELTEVRKALSGVARMSYKVAPRVWQARFGREKIVKSLAGSKDEKLLSAGIDKLSTYGILKPHGAKFCSELFTSMIDANLVEVIDGDYPLVAITDFGVSVMLGEVSELRMRYPRWASKIWKENAKPKKEKKTSSKSKKIVENSDEPLSASDQALYDKLATLRLTMSRIRHVRPFQIFTNATLRELAIHKPRTQDDALHLKGIGEVNARKFLPRFLEIINNFSDY
jgi:ATP-dependent DNA helicase RecQ